MSTMSPNTSLLDAKNASPSNLTPAPLTGPSSAVVFAFQGLQPPSNLYVNVDDQLIISAATSQTAEVVTINARLLMPNGRVEDMQFQIRPANTRVVLKQAFPLAEGFLLSVSASAAVAVTRGQTFVRVSLQRSASGAGQPAYCLMADYATTQAVPGYPNGRTLSPTEGPGNVYTFSNPPPAAGNDFNCPVPTYARWRIRAVTAQLTTSAGVVNREPALIIYQSGNITYQAAALVVQTASTTVFYSGVGLTPYTQCNPLIQLIGMPPDLVLSGQIGAAASIRSNTINLQGADQWTSQIFIVEEWLDNV